MKSLIFVLILLWTNCVTCLDRFLDINLTTDFANLKQRSHVDFNSQAVVPFSTRAFLLNPRISLFFDGSMDVSLATGLRHQFTAGTLGHHVFWNSTATRDAHFHQIGHSLEFLTDMFDYRFNHYHPVSKQQEFKKYMVSPHRWSEFDVIYKHPMFQIGVGPKYDFFQKTLGMQGKVTFPFQHFSVGSMISYDNINRLSGCVSVSFRLYGTARKSAMESPIQYQSRVIYSKEPIFVPPPKQSKKRVCDKPAVHVAKKEEVPVILPEPIKEEITDVPVVKPKSWWNFFFRAPQKNL